MRNYDCKYHNEMAFYQKEHRVFGFGAFIKAPHVFFLHNDSCHSAIEVDLVPGPFRIIGAFPGTAWALEGPIGEPAPYPS